MMVLYDQSGLAAGNLALTPAAFAIVTLMNGQNTLGDIVAEFLQQFRQPLPGERLLELLHQLDRRGMLDGPVFDARYERLVEDYRQLPARPTQAVTSGADLEELRSELCDMVGEGTATTEGQRVVGLVAPHLDYERGRCCYAEAYAQLRGQDDIDRFVIVGTNHFGRSGTVAWTVKDYDTPFGPAETDRGFIDKLRGRIGVDLGVHELDHLHEHSVELQVVILKALRGSRPVRIVPLLCPDVCGPTGLKPGDGSGPGADEFAAALAEVLAGEPGRSCVIAGADLSHVGRRFGDDFDLDDEFLQAVEADDRALLDLIEVGDAAGLLARLHGTRNLYRVCGAGSIYILLRALGGPNVRMLRYHQAVNRDEQIAVTCVAGLVVADGAA